MRDNKVQIGNSGFNFFNTNVSLPRLSMERQSEGRLLGRNFYGNCFIRGCLSAGAGARTNVSGLLRA